MDSVEELKSRHATNDAVIDDLAAQAYIEQFGAETFQRADNAMRANKASRQTADTFLAAATFLDLLHVWGSTSPEIASQVKYAKYNAARILKALKAGEDPNLTNPVPHLSEEHVELDSKDPDVQHINGITARQASVEDATDADNDDYGSPGLAATSTMDTSLHPSRSTSIPRSPNTSRGMIPRPDTGVSPLSATDKAAHTDDISQGDAAGAGGYFPEVSPTSPPEAASSLSGNATLPDNQVASPVSSSTLPPEANFYGQVSSSVLPHHEVKTSRPSASSSLPGHASEDSHVHEYVADDAAVADAQKHAKWAISALNFEDANTAVKELRLALKALGAH
ncbi:MAG: hypothetical protein M1828_005360 [Chrysothrix sp. TS-e1954]|nr:MAG: hypothetical protein M1828_005360 [Chrysothrix sp. TS-e1954]